MRNGSDLVQEFHRAIEGLGAARGPEPELELVVHRVGRGTRQVGRQRDAELLQPRCHRQGLAPRQGVGVAVELAVCIGLAVRVGVGVGLAGVGLAVGETGTSQPPDVSSHAARCSAQSRR